MSNSIRVLHTEWSDGWGGQEIRIINEMKVMRSRGVEVFLACRALSVIREKALQNHIKVFTLGFKGNGDLKTLLSLKKIIQKNSIDIVNTHSGKDSWVGGFAAKLAGVKFIRTRHLSNRISKSRMNFINEIADYIFTTGEKVRSDMIQYNRINKNKILSIPTGIDESVFNPRIFNREECREKFNLSDNEIAIGILAVLRKFKRHDIFIKSAKALIELYPEKKLVFLIAGDGPQKENIKNLVNEHDLFSKVRMVGHVNNAPEFLSAIDILVLCSDSKEGVPQSVMQGLFMNKPVVASNSGSINDIHNKENFQLVEKGDVDSLVNGISFYIDNFNEIDTREYMIKYFSTSVMSQKVIDTYKKILNYQ
jgi:glycosyltransferase involved in cell wall biosynthesis